tara:strand:+ start:2302 stop:3414 length:1113 start_codon:yes stop_codon:yes gene_type:complete
MNSVQISHPKISVIIPVYNGERTLRRCLDSVLAQTYPNYEIIVVNNNSTDTTKQLILEYQKNHSAVFYSFEPYRSRGAARNNGIKKATGEILAMIDSDCISNDCWLSQITAPLRSGDETIVMGGEIDPVDNFWTRRIHNFNRNYYISHSDGVYIIALDSKNFAVRRNVIIKYMFDREICNAEDFEFSIRITGKEKIRFLSEVCVNHFHKSSLLGWTKIVFNRGYWSYKIHLKHRKNNVYKRVFSSFFNATESNFFIYLISTVRASKRYAIQDFFFLYMTVSYWQFGMVLCRLDLFSNKADKDIRNDRLILKQFDLIIFPILLLLSLIVFPLPILAILYVYVKLLIWRLGSVFMKRRKVLYLGGDKSTSRF